MHRYFEGQWPKPPPKKGALRGWVVNTNYPVVKNMQLKEKTTHFVIISDFNLDVLINWAPRSPCLIFNGSGGGGGVSWQLCTFTVMQPCILERPISSARLWKEKNQRREGGGGGKKEKRYCYIKTNLYRCL